jgi:hypothetical protein
LFKSGFLTGASAEDFLFENNPPFGYNYYSTTKALSAIVHAKLVTIFNILKAVLSHTHYQNWTALSGVALLVLVFVGQKYPYKCDCHQT